MFPYPDVHEALTAHQMRAEELRAQAAHDRLVRSLRAGPEPHRARWWSRAGRRLRHGATRTPALP